MVNVFAELFRTASRTGQHAAPHPRPASEAERRPRLQAPQTRDTRD